MKPFNRKLSVSKAKSGYDMPMSAAGRPTEHVSVVVAQALGGQGVNFAAKLLETVEVVYRAVAGLWSPRELPGVTLLLANLSSKADGTGGAYHWGCDGLQLYVDADLINKNGISRSEALFAGELCDVFAAQSGKGWICTDSMGEGLSRFTAELTFPGALDDYACVPSWLDGPRANYVTSKDNTDTNENANACTLCFYWWMVYSGIAPSAICGAGGDTLLDLYARITGKNTGWEDFSANIEALWPRGKVSGVKTDNPFPVARSVPVAEGLPSMSVPRPAADSNVVTMTQGLPAGSYLQVGEALTRAATLFGISFAEIMQIVSILLSAQGQPLTLATITAIIAQIQQVLAGATLRQAAQQAASK
jgi:hypothetical protein